MKLLLTTIAAVVLVGCGESQSPAPPTAKAPDIDIHTAAMMGNIEAVKQHLAAGTDVNGKVDDVWEWTPLHSAASGGNEELVELLLAKGADVNAKVGDARLTPLFYAADKGHKEIAELLRKHGGTAYNLEGWEKPEAKPVEPVAEAAKLEPSLVKAPNISIHAAARTRNIEAVKQHLAAGTDVNVKDDRGMTPLDVAILYKLTETADLIRKHGGKTGEELK
jgi:ankyrin repeat protein